MQYGQIRRMVIEHIDTYSAAGNLIPPSYNGQQDYYNRIPHLINHALEEIQEALQLQTNFAELTDPEVIPGFVRYPLPEDCFRILTGEIWIRAGEGPLHRTGRGTVSGRALQIPRPRRLPPDRLTWEEADTAQKAAILAALPEVYAEYVRRPHLLPEEPADDFELDEPEDMIRCAALWAAAQLVMREDEFVYASLSNEYETRLARLRPGVRMEQEDIRDPWDPWDLWEMGGVPVWPE